MSYRLKNSDLEPFLCILSGKMSDLWVCRRGYMGVFLG
nr:MAG TPA: hypothetical protein [Bacteriophage sp.]